MTEQSPTLLAFDPGDPHVGVAKFVRDPFDKWRCEDAWELTPFTAGRYLESQLPFVDVVVYETFQIYPDKAKVLIGSKCETAQTIGMIRWIVSSYNGGIRLIDLHEQPAAIQEPTLGLLKAKGMRSQAKATKSGPHALSAELHGWAFLFQNGLAE